MPIVYSGVHILSIFILNINKDLLRVITFILFRSQRNVAAGGLLVPSTSERRRSSCKLTVSPISVQTRLAATTSRGPSNQNSASSSIGNPPSTDSVFLPSNKSPTHTGEESKKVSPKHVINVPSIQIFENTS